MKIGNIFVDNVFYWNGFLSNANYDILTFVYLSISFIFNYIACHNHNCLLVVTNFLLFSNTEKNQCLFKNIYYKI